MKTGRTSPSLCPRSRSEKGVALILVLGSLVLISLMVLVLMSLARTEQQSSFAFSESSHVRTLSEIPINLAIGQLRKGTEQIGGQKSWTSQPGMIRTFGTTDDGSGVLSKPSALYKLYSDDEMVVAGTNGGELSPAQVQAAIQKDVTGMTNWKTQPGLYADLNEPVPVMDHTGTIPEWEFPIVDPRGMADAGDDGKAIEGLSAKPSFNGTLLPTSRTDSKARLPMPVRWIYVLKDGRMASPADEIDGKVTFSTQPGAVAPTPANPIVGRVAFWTDDESSKVNINTALEGIPWETPRTTSPRDFKYAERMPARNEFSRYPGHPAQTSLSPVFQAFGKHFDITPDLSDAELVKRLEKLHAMSPRYVWGGTQGGTRKATEAVLNNKTDRLYATLDELLYDTSRNLNDSGIDGRDLAISKFVLTTNSRAHELNPLNKPKVLLWPLSASNNDRTAMDRLMAMLASGGVVGGNARSQGWILERAENAKVIDGIVGSGHTTFQDLNTRNSSVMGDYVRYYMGNKIGSSQQRIPGFASPVDATGGAASFASRNKLGDAKRTQLLVSMVDLMRFGINTENTVEKGLPNGKTYKYLPPHQDPVNNPSRRGESSAAPLVAFNASKHNTRSDKSGDAALVSSYGGFTHGIGSLGGAKGYGRFPTFTEATLVFHRRTATTMRAFLILEPFSPTNGPPAWTANYRYRILFAGQENNKTAKSAVVNFGAAQTDALGKARTKAWLSDSVPSFQMRFNDNQDWLPMKFPRPHNPAGPQTAPAGDIPTNETNPNLGGLGTPDLNVEKANAPYGTIRDTWPVSMVNWPVDLMKDSTIADITKGTGNTTPFAGLLTQFKQARQDQAKLLDDQIPVGKVPNPPDAWKSTNWTRTNHVAHANYFPFYTRDVIEIPVNATNFQFSGGEITVAVFLGWTGDDKHLPVQRLHFTFPPAIFPVPTNAAGAFAPRFNSGRAEGMRTNTMLPGDVTRSIEPFIEGTPKGDLRFYAGMENVPSEYFAPGPNYFNTGVQMDHGLRDGTWMTERQLGNITTRSTAGTLLKDVVYPDDAIPAVTRGLNGAYRINGRPGDWDNGVGGIEDGPYVNKPDEGTGALELGGYFSRGGHYAATDDITFSPNRMVASAVVFGSLPTGIMQNWVHPEGYPTNTAATDASNFKNWPARQPAPWQTLLFCPNPAGRTTPAGTEPNMDDHPGFTAPRDHLLLDAFNMPVVEPYAISDNFSTAGKINLNHQILPFTHIERSTGLHAVFKGTHVTAIPTSEINNYKKNSGKNPGNDLEFRYAIDTPVTLQGLNKRFTNYDVYRAPSEICTIFLAPKRLPGGNYGSAKAVPSSYDSLNEWWNGSITNMSDAMELTGDNVREAPYNAIYPRLTTQSNTYTVHYRVQTLRKARSTDPTVWVEGSDAVNSEYRGAAIVERYLDPNEQELGSSGLGGEKFTNSWDGFFRLRVIQNKQFSR